jgi:SNF2 family DNA or RNA helicase
MQFLREFGLHGILADDMGLGKTLQTLTHILIEKECGRMKHPCLIVAPTSVLRNWINESIKFTPTLSLLLMHGQSRKSDSNTSSNTISSSQATRCSCAMPM